MDDRDKLFYLLEHYYRGNLNTIDFEDQFHIAYREINKNKLSVREHSLMRELFDLAARFSPSEDDHKYMPGVYFTEQDVRNKATEVYQQLIGTK